MSSSTCYYHPQREAVEKCERCHRMICLQDTTKVRNRRSHGIGSQRSYSYYEVIYCPICHYEATEEGEKLLDKFGKFGIGFGVIFGLLFITALGFGFLQFLEFRDKFNQGAPDSMQIGLFPFIVFGFMALIALSFLLLPILSSGMLKNKMRSTKSKSYNRKQQFLQTVTNNDFIKSYDPAGKLTCNQCGSKITFDSIFCQYCGDSTKDERNQMI